MNTTRGTRTCAQAGRWWVILAVVPVLAAACDKGQDERIRKARAKALAKMKHLLKKHRPTIDAKVRNARATKTLLANIARAKPDARVPVLKPPIKIMERHMDAADATADAMFEKEVTALTRGILGSCSYHFEKDTLRPDLAEDMLPRCARVRYFLVVRPTTYSPPRLDDKTRTYSGGVMRGDVVIFELEGKAPPKLRGTFPISARLPAKVRVDATDTHSIKEYSVNEQLRKVMLEAIEKKVLAAK